MRYKEKIPIEKKIWLEFISITRELVSKMLTISKMNKKNLLSKVFDNRQNFPYDLAIAVIIKNEAPYILEWIEYHRLIGFSRFYIYDNDSTDNVENMLKGYIKRGIVVFTKVTGSGKQIYAYENAVKLAKNEVRWLAIIDADEFIQNLTDKSLLDLIEQSRRSATLIGWMIFGSNEQKYKEEGLVIERFTHHATENFKADYKIILNPRKILKFKGPHYAQMIGLVKDENGKTIRYYPYITLPQTLPASKKHVRINHYYSKSLEEFNSKKKRGFADKSQNKRDERSIKDFEEHDRNEIEDHSMKKYAYNVQKNVNQYMKLNNLHKF